ncbi:MAG: alpha/beta fold hydrolase [Panacagrimonas sp.]
MNPEVEARPLQTIRANGLDFAYFEAGEGPLVILLHGFPDGAYCYRDILPRLAAAGYRAVAPFLRGYAPTSLAPDGDYSLPTLAKDLIALVEHFGRGEKAYVVGHDWGSPIAQYAVNLRPDRFHKIVIAAVPHLRKFLLSPTRAQLRRSHYIFKFQVPFWAERRLVENDFAWMVDVLIRRWSPGWNFREADIAPVKAGFSDPARLAAALAYYRRIPGLLAQPALWKTTFSAITVPTCMIYGTEDGCVGPEMFEGQAKRFKAGFELCEATGMGHFMQWENPAWFSDRVIGFLQKTE